MAPKVPEEAMTASLWMSRLGMMNHVVRGATSTAAPTTTQHRFQIIKWFRKYEAPAAKKTVWAWKVTCERADWRSDAIAVSLRLSREEYNYKLCSARLLGQKTCLKKEILFKGAKKQSHRLLRQQRWKWLQDRRRYTWIFYLDSSPGLLNIIKSRKTWDPWCLP